MINVFNVIVTIRTMLFDLQQRSLSLLVTAVIQSGVVISDVLRDAPNWTAATLCIAVAYLAPKVM